MKMKEKKDCKIVQDLLPNYIDNLTNEETNAYIEKHLEECEECKTIYENMKKELKIGTEKPDKREINFFKKYRNKLRILRIILLVIFMIFVLDSCRKIIIISDLSNKAEQYAKSSNYHKISIYWDYENEGFTKVEVYRLGDKIKNSTTQLSTDFTNKVITAFGRDRKIDAQNIEHYITNIYEEENGKKTKAILNTESTITNRPENILKTENWWELLIHAICANIRETNYNGEKCYYIANFDFSQDTNSYGMYVNKNTGLTVGFGQSKAVGEIITGTQNYKYEFDTVTEEDFIEPDPSEYENVYDASKD